MGANRPPLPVALLPALGFAVLEILAERSGFDLWVADRFADGSAGFPYAHRWWSEQLMHDGAQWLVRIVAVALLAFAILRRGTSQLRPLLYLIVCLAVTTGSVGWIKHATIKSCPWALQRYGGGSAYVELGDAT